MSPRTLRSSTRWLAPALAMALLHGPAAAREPPGASAPPEAADVAPATSILRGTLRRRGVRAPAAGVEIRALGPDGALLGSEFSDADGRFALALPAGPVRLQIEDVSYSVTEMTVELPDTGLDVGEWRLSPTGTRDQPVTVYGRRPPASVGLGAEELRAAAGTLGDPLRALQSLPSVGTILSLVPFPVVRGSAPGETGILVDGTPIPLLFHSGVGQGVVPAVLVDRLTLHPSGAPLSIGRFTSAIEVRTAEPDAPGVRGDVLLDLVQAGALLSAPLDESGRHRVTVSGRIGYPGWLLGLLDQPVVIDFADYHLRYRWRDGRRRARISLFGATDRFGDAAAPDGEPALTEMTFHRLALRWFEPLGDATLEAALDLGLDRFDLPVYGEEDVYFFRSASGADIDELSARGRLILDVPFGRAVSLDAGIEGAWIRTENHAPVTPGELLVVDGVRSRPLGGAWVAVTLRAGPLRLTPGVRADIYGAPLRWGIDPRLDARLVLAPGTAIIGRAGITHAPLRYAYPIPGIGEYARAEHLQRTLHGQLGVEQQLDEGLELRWTVFAQQTDGMQASGLDPEPIPAPLAGSALGAPPVSPFTSSTAAVDGRGFGSELMLRRRPGGWIHGWLSYTVQRVERRLDDPDLGPIGPWHASQLEQNHLLNAVLTLRLPGGFSVGGRLHWASGRPDSPGGFVERRRLDGYGQLDLRVEYQWVADLFEGSAWLDVVNVTHAAEPTRTAGSEPSDGLAYTLPMLGVRARF